MLDVSQIVDWDDETRAVAMEVFSLTNRDLDAMNIAEAVYQRNVKHPVPLGREMHGGEPFAMLRAYAVQRRCIAVMLSLIKTVGAEQTGAVPR